jgi:hypothetical protein
MGVPHNLWNFTTRVSHRSGKCPINMARDPGRECFEEVPQRPQALILSLLCGQQHSGMGSHEPIQSNPHAAKRRHEATEWEQGTVSPHTHLSAHSWRDSLANLGQGGAGSMTALHFWGMYSPEHGSCLIAASLCRDVRRILTHMSDTNQSD